MSRIYHICFFFAALPEYNPCMFGLTKFNEHDSDDENPDEGFAPYYVSYSLVGSKRPAGKTL